MNHHFGKSAFMPTYSLSGLRESAKQQKEATLAREQAARHLEGQLMHPTADSSTESLEPAIDGPPSSEQIRAYTEQMKRSSVFASGSRPQTTSSGSSSFRSSRDSSIGSMENLTLSRKTSNRSHASTMPSKAERPDSVQIFGKSIFSRNGRKQKRGTSTGDATPPLPSPDDASAKERYYGKGTRSRNNSMGRTRSFVQEPKRHVISGPYNFQHVTQIRQDDLSQPASAELLSNLRASQAPNGQKSQELPFENFSSVSGNEGFHHDAERASILRSPPRRRNTLQKPNSPPQVPYIRSHDNLRRRTPPPRPPRSPLLPTCPIDLPERTSSRTASILYETFDQPNAATIERPQTTHGVRASPLYTPPVLQQAWTPQQDYFSERPVSHAITTPGDEAWPLSSSTTESFPNDLADVPEEDEAAMAQRRSRMSRSSITSPDLRVSQSVPSLRLKALDHASLRPVTALSTMLEDAPEDRVFETRQQPLSPKFAQDSWEDDIDYIYEHEAEADCDFQWERSSVGNGSSDETTVDARSPKMSPYSEQVLEEGMDYHLQDERQLQPGRFRPSLLVPAPYEVPELSPMSSNSAVESDPHTPANLLRPNHVRNASRASSFKESHGFTLSPTLLIPKDFATQMEHEVLYEEFIAEQDDNKGAAGAIFTQEQYQPISPIDEALSSTASFRSSDFSRGSARSSSSTRFSTMNPRASQDSTYMQSRAASLGQEHRSFGSATSLPDLIPSIRKSDVDLPSRMAALNVSSDEIQEDGPAAPSDAQATAPGPNVPLARKKPSLESPPARKGINHFAPPPVPATPVEGNANLSPVAEGFANTEATDASLASNNANGPSHGRNVSVPLLSSPKREIKGRARASSSAAAIRNAEKRRGSYMLFPQVPSPTTTSSK